MKQPALPANERERLSSLHRYRILDTPNEIAFDRITRLASRLLDTPVSLLTLLDKDRQWFKSRVGLEHEGGSREASFCAHAINQHNVMVINDAIVDERFRDNPWVVKDPRIRFYAGAPLRTTEGHALGTLCVIDQKPRHDFSDVQRRNLQDLADLAMTQIEMRQSASHIDPTTGVYSRRKFVEVLNREAEQTRHDGRQRLVAAVDIALSNRFNEIVRVMGYAYAEDFIQESLRRIEDVLGEGHDLYRIGLLRFGFVISDYAGPFTRTALDRLAEALCEPIRDPQGISLRPMATIGLADLMADYDNPAEHVLRAATLAADSALEAKRPWAFYTPDDDEIRRRRFSMMADLPIALESDDQLYLQYQPQIDLSTGTSDRVEVLLRWRHPTLGEISPAELIEAIEHTGLMSDLTDWVLDRALSQAAAWHRAGIVKGVAVNISATDLADPGLRDRIAAHLRTHGLDGSVLEVEFTESAVIQGIDTVASTLESVRELGVSMAIDDFGTGYCNMMYLQKIPADTIKIDRSFIRDLSPDSRQCRIIEAIVSLAATLGLAVVAEGVENRAVLDLLSQMACDRAQGFHIGAPMHAHQIASEAT